MTIFSRTVTYKRLFAKFRLKLSYRKLVFPFLLTILDPPGGYRFLARRRVRPSPFLVDQRDLNPRPFAYPKAERLSEPNILRPDIRQYTRPNYRPQKCLNKHSFSKKLVLSRISRGSTPRPRFRALNAWRRAPRRLGRAMSHWL